MQEFALWKAYQRIEPWGEMRADLRMGILACVMASPHVKKGTRLKPSDFMPDFTGKSKKQTSEQMMATMKAFAAAHNAAIKKKQTKGTKQSQQQSED